MKKRILFVFCLSFTLYACDDSQTLEGETHDGIESYHVEIRMNDVKTGNIDLADMSDKVVEVTANAQTSKAIKLADIISTINGIESDKLDDYLSLYECDFESSADSFRSSSKGERCSPLNCSVAKDGYVNVDSHRLFFSDNSIVTEGCYSIRDLGAVLMYDIDKEAVNFWIYLDNVGLQEVNASKLTTVTVNGQKAVTLETLLKAAKSDLDLSTVKCDFRMAGSKKLVSEIDTACVASTCSDIKDQYIILDNQSVNDGQDTQACYEVENVTAIYVSTIKDSYDPYSIAIKVNGKDYATVDISSLSEKATIVSSVAAVSVSDIFAAAGLDIDWEKAQCEGGSLNNANPDDDYRPSYREKCKQLLTCDVFAKGTVSLINGKLTGPEGSAKCYNVTDFNTIEVTF